MHSVYLGDDQYNMAARLATKRGLQSVEDYIVRVIVEESETANENYDHVFTPEVMRAIARGLADADAGRTFTPEQVLEEMEEWRREWRRSKAS